MTRKININLIGLLIIIAVFNYQVNAKTNISELKSHKTTLYLGKFCKLPTTNFCVLYDGEIIDIIEAIFTIKDRLLQTINFLFVDLEQIKFCLEDHTVQEMTLKTKDYKFFELDTTKFPMPNDLNNSYSSSWKISNKILDDLKIPLNTIIIPLSPSLVEINLENNINKPSSLAINLPKIKLSAKTGQSLTNLMLESYLKAISLKPFYAKQRVRSINQNAIKVSLII